MSLPLYSMVPESHLAGFGNQSEDTKGSCSFTCTGFTNETKGLTGLYGEVNAVHCADVAFLCLKMNGKIFDISISSCLLSLLTHTGIHGVTQAIAQQVEAEFCNDDEQGREYDGVPAGPTSHRHIVRDRC